MSLDTHSQNTVERRDVVLRKFESKAAIYKDWVPWAVTKQVRRLLVEGGLEVWPNWDPSLPTAGEEDEGSEK